jgi:hypothetical protein
MYPELWTTTMATTKTLPNTLGLLLQLGSLMSRSNSAPRDRGSAGKLQGTRDMDHTSSP